MVRQQTAILVDYFDPNSERWNNLEKITAPTMIIHGTEDPLVPIAAAEDLAALIPNAELRVIPGLGHTIPIELIPEITDAIMAAVEATAQPPTAENSLVGSSWQLTSFRPVGFGLQHVVFALISSALAYATGFFLWGLGAGLIYQRQGRLSALIIAHFISNPSFGVIPLLMISQGR